MMQHHVTNLAAGRASARCVAFAV